MIEWSLLALGAAAATTALAPAVLRLLHRLGALDVPNHRSSHEEPTIRGGGVACALGILATATVAHVFGLDVPWPALAAGLAMALLGFVTDLRDPSAIARLGLQIATGAALGGVLGGPGSLLLGAVAFPALINAVNFMDGINGITGLTVCAWALVMLFIGPSPETLVLAALAGGAALAFLPWNVPTARMFLGDCGSYLFGGILAAALVSEQVSAAGLWWLVATPLLPYLLDTGSTLVRRAIRGENLVEAHREHIYQRLSRRPGWTHVRVALLYAVLALASGAAAGYTSLAT